MFSLAVMLADTELLDVGTAATVIRICGDGEEGCIT